MERRGEEKRRRVIEENTEQRERGGRENELQYINK